MANSKSGFSWVDYLIFGLALTLSALVGVYHAWNSNRLLKKKRKESQNLEYLMGGRKMPIIPVALSVMSTFMSGISLLGVPAEIYNRGLLFFPFYLSGLVSLIVTAIFFLPIFFDLRPVSIYEYFELRFGSRALRRLAAALFILNTLFYMAVVMYAPAVSLAGVTGVPVWPFVLSVGIVSTFYTSIGGLKAVVWTDTLQCGFMYAGILAVIIKGAMHAGGMGRVFEIAFEGGRVAPLTYINPTPAQHFSLWIAIFGGMGFWFSTFGLNQMAIQRYCSLPSLRHANIVVIITIPLFLMLATMCVLVGMVMLAYFYNCDPIKAGEVDTSDQLVVLFVTKILSGLPGLPGLFLSCLFSGTLSTVSSGLNSLAAVTWEDFLKQYLWYKIGDVGRSRLNKGMVVFFGVVATALAFAAGPMGGILKAAMNMIGALGGPLVGLFFLGVFVPRASKQSAFLGGLGAAGLLLWICMGNIIYKPYEDYQLASNGTAGCPGNTTFKVANQSIPDFDPHFGDPRIMFPYRISSFFYPFLGILLVVLFGFGLSFIWRQKYTNLPTKTEVDDGDIDEDWRPRKLTFIPPAPSAMTLQEMELNDG